MAERQSRGVLTLQGATLAQLRHEVQFALQHLANQVDQVVGLRGTPTFYAALNVTGKRVMHLAAPEADTDALPAGLALRRLSPTAPFDAGGVAIINVPQGSAQTDAVNVSQLNAAIAAAIGGLITMSDLSTVIDLLQQLLVTTTQGAHYDTSSRAGTHGDEPDDEQQASTPGR